MGRAPATSCASTLAFAVDMSLTLTGSNEHVDAYPFVCVVMFVDPFEIRCDLADAGQCRLSDVSNMIGGETGLRCGDGSMLKARGPGVGSAVVMQGRYVHHVALKAFNTPEVRHLRCDASRRWTDTYRQRITMVCSLRAKDPMLEDASEARHNIHCVSKPNRFKYVLFHGSTTLY